eukprot:4516886-Prymnesium_polylepis.1
MRTCLLLALLRGAAASNVDPLTPAWARTTRLLSSSNSPPFVATFTDEFETAGRQFGEGEDAKWTAINSYNPSTSDLEAYVPSHASTVDGKLRLTVSSNITVDVSGSARPFTSAMLQTWNRTCLQGGVLEVSLRLPGRPNITGLWPAVWLLGNLGRTGFGREPDGSTAVGSLNGMVRAQHHQHRSPSAGPIALSMAHSPSALACSPSAQPIRDADVL